MQNVIHVIIYFDTMGNTKYKVIFDRKKIFFTFFTYVSQYRRLQLSLESGANLVSSVYEISSLGREVERPRNASKEE